MIALDKETWEEHVPNSKGWVVVDFLGPRCKPCLELYASGGAPCGEIR